MLRVQLRVFNIEFWRRLSLLSTLLTSRDVTRQQRMGEQSRLFTWPDVNVLNFGGLAGEEPTTVGGRAYSVYGWQEQDIRLYFV
jgi:hypothetical protein